MKITTIVITMSGLFLPVPGHNARMSEALQVNR